jgi:hypothetical protein
VPEIKPVDYETRVRFCNRFINHVHDRLLDPKLTFFTDEANFNLSGYVNTNFISLMTDVVSNHKCTRIFPMPVLVRYFEPSSGVQVKVLDF